MANIARNCINVLGPAELHALLMQHANDPAARAKLADGLFRLLLLQTSYMANQPDRSGTIVAVVPMSSRDKPEFSWDVYRTTPSGERVNVIAGGLVCHTDDDGVWGIHT